MLLPFAALLLSAWPANTLADLSTMNADFHFDIRYATENNLLHRRLYRQPNAFLQTEAARALKLAAADLRKQGYGLLIYDAYRPLSVTKEMWEATTEAQHTYLADPKVGSKHNRGCAVDLTLYDLKTGAPVAMPSDYDEMSARSSPDYTGGTAAERAHRDLLRHSMEAQGFSVNKGEWWHFDFKGWEAFPVSDVKMDGPPFDGIRAR